MGDGSMGDGPPAGCPSSYMTINGGGTHLYKAITQVTPWMNQRDRCLADSTSAYLAIPNDATEMQGIIGLSAAPLTWVGIHDQNTEGTFETVRGDPAPIPPLVWASGEPNNQSEQDCVAAIMPSGTIQTDRCGSVSYAAVCECEP
jgi:hypothetical protein